MSDAEYKWRDNGVNVFKKILRLIWLTDIITIFNYVEKKGLLNKLSEYK